MTDDLPILLTLNDAELRPFLTASDEPSRRQALEQLVVAIVRPTIARVIGRVIRASSALHPQDADDLAASVVVRILEKLHALSTSEEHAIRKLDDYVARLTLNAIADSAREQAPAVRTLRRRLRQALLTDARLTSWETAAGTICGLASWRERKDVRLRIDVDVTVLGDRDAPAEALFALLTVAGAPLPLHVATRTLADAWKLPDARTCALRDDVTADTSAPGSDYETREQLHIVWEEILALPRRQRAALLLNLRDGIGLNAVVLFPLTGVASFGDIAAAIGISAGELAALWNRLPLPDNTVAEVLEVTRQQVINLRKSARARLQRRIVTRQRGSIHD